jgi:hypothetical protein
MITKSTNVLSLVVLIDGEIFFQSYGKWLYPLFDFESYLVDHPIIMRKVEICDKVIGKAAAMLMVHLGADHVHGELMSDLAVQVFEQWDLPYTYDQRVERIDCQTEALLLAVNNIDEAYQILCKRAQRC